MEAKDKLISDHAIRTVNMKVEMLRSKCEVAVYDLSDLQQSLIHLSSNVTYREIGPPNLLSIIIFKNIFQD